MDKRRYHVVLEELPDPLTRFGNKARSVEDRLGLALKRLKRDFGLKVAALIPESPRSSPPSFCNQ
jgi:hypothetical protein